MLKRSKFDWNRLPNLLLKFSGITSRKSIKIVYKFISPLLNIAKYVKFESMTNVNWCKIFHFSIAQFMKIIEKSSLSHKLTSLKDISFASIRDAIDESRKLNFSLLLQQHWSFFNLKCNLLSWSFSLADITLTCASPIYANLWSRKFNLRGFFSRDFCYSV